MDVFKDYGGLGFGGDMGRGISSRTSEEENVRLDMASLK